MKKFLILLVAVGVIAAAYAGYKSTMTSPSGDSAAAPQTATYRCEEDAHAFIAEFSASGDEVTISSEGEENTFPRIQSVAGMQYGDGRWTFVFSGDTATSTLIGGGTQQCTKV